MPNETKENAPVKTYRIGHLSATIWKNAASGNDFYSTEIARNYKNEEDEWKSSSSFNHSDLLNVAELAKRAERYIAEQLSL